MRTIKYFFVLDAKGKRHIVVAKDSKNAVELISKAGMKFVDIYELTEERFNEPGFLISDK